MLGLDADLGDDSDQPRSPRLDEGLDCQCETVRKAFSEQDLLLAARQKAGRLYADPESPYRGASDYHRDLGLLIDFVTDLWIR